MLLSSGLITPPTILRTCLLGASVKRVWSDPIHDADLLLVNLDSLHHGPKNFASRLPAQLLQLLRNPSGEFLQLTDYEPELRLLGYLAHLSAAIVMPLGEAFFRRQDPRLEFRLV